MYTDWIDECDRVNAIHNDLGGRQGELVCFLSSGTDAPSLRDTRLADRSDLSA